MGRVAFWSLIFLAATLLVSPAAADRCADDADPALQAAYEAVMDRIAEQREAGHYGSKAQHWSHDLALNRIVEIEASDAVPRAAVETVRRALGNIDAALSLVELPTYLAMGGPPSTRKVVVRLIDIEAPGRVEAWTYCEPTTCTVELFPVIWGAAPEAAGFTLAHEMFHIVQSLTFPRVDHCHSFWWVEGTAEWFANLAFPNQPYTADAGFPQHFDRTSASTRIIDMDYEAVVFFFWASQRFGHHFPLSLGAFGNAGLNTVEAVNSLLSPEDWADFVQRYLTGWIVYPDGRRVIPEPDLGPLIAVASDSPVTIEGPPMSIPRARLALGAGTWTLTRTDAGGTDYGLAKHETLSQWELLARDATVTRYYSCEGEAELPVAAIGGAAGGTKATFLPKVSVTGCDACLVGLWQQRVTRGAEAGFVELFAPWGSVYDQENGYGFVPHGGTEAMSFTVTYDNPGPLLAIRPDGTFLLNDPRLILFEGEPDGGWAVHRTHYKLSGYEGGWHEEDGRIVARGLTKLRAGSFTFFASLANGGILQGGEEFDDSRPLKRMPDITYDAVCSRDLLTLQRHLPGLETELQYFDRMP